MSLLLFALLAFAHASYDPRLHCADMFVSTDGELRARLLRERKISPVEAERTAIVSGYVRSRLRNPLDLAKLAKRWSRILAVVVRPVGPPLLFESAAPYEPVDPTEADIIEISVPEMDAMVREVRGEWAWDKAPRQVDVGAITKLEFIEWFEAEVRRMFSEGLLDNARLRTAIVVRNLVGHFPVLLINAPIEDQGSIVGYGLKLYFFDPRTRARIEPKSDHQYRLDNGFYYLLRNGQWFARPSAHVLGRVRDEAEHESFREFLVTYPAALNEMPFGIELVRARVDKALSQNNNYLVLSGFDSEGLASNLRLVFDPNTKHFVALADLRHQTFTFENDRVFTVDSRGEWRDRNPELMNESLKIFLAQFPEALVELPSHDRLEAARADEARDERSDQVFWILDGFKSRDGQPSDLKMLFDPNARRFVNPSARTAPRGLTLVLHEGARLGFNLNGRVWTELPRTGEFERSLARERAAQRR